MTIISPELLNFAFSNNDNIYEFVHEAAENYLSKHNLILPNNQIIIDERLSQLFNVKEGPVHRHYFNSLFNDQIHI